MERRASHQEAEYIFCGAYILFNRHVTKPVFNLLSDKKIPFRTTLFGAESEQTGAEYRKYAIRMQYIIIVITGILLLIKEGSINFRELEKE